MNRHKMILWVLGVGVLAACSFVPGCLPERQAPHIYSEPEFVDLLAAARRLGPAPGLRGVVFETLFGLIGSCGLRLSEAVGLRNMDVDLEQGMLTLRRTKFGQVASGADASQLHRGIASLSIDARPVRRIGTGRGRVLHRHARAATRHATEHARCGTRLRRIARATGLAQPRRSPCSTHTRPQTHDGRASGDAVACPGRGCRSGAKRTPAACVNRSR